MFTASLNQGTNQCAAFCRFRSLQTVEEKDSSDQRWVISTFTGTSRSRYKKGKKIENKLLNIFFKNIFFSHLGFQGTDK